MEEYIKETTLMDYSNEKIQSLITARGWRKLDRYHQIEAVYKFVQNEIAFGFNDSDVKKASEVLREGIGQCNTKSLLLMTLLRALGIPTRHHVVYLDSSLQAGVISKMQMRLAPKKLIHTWAEVYNQDEWITLEGVILDLTYLHQVQKMYLVRHPSVTVNDVVPYVGYAIATKDLFHPKITWDGQSTYIQNEVIQKDLGVFSTYDESFRTYQQTIGAWKEFLYRKVVSKRLTKKVKKIRNRS